MALVFAGVIGVLSIANAASLVAEYGYGKDHLKGLVQLFRLNAEGNIPTFYSALTLFIGAILCVAIARTHQLSKSHRPLWWYGAATVLLFLCFDEAGQIHELLDTHRGWTEGLFEPTGALIGPWVVVYGAGAAALGIAFLPFFLSLPKRTQLLLGFSSAMFITGAIGFEMAGAAEWTLKGDSLKFEVINSIEEMMEMTAVAIAILSLLDYMKTQFGWVGVAFLPAGVGVRVRHRWNGAAPLPRPANDWAPKRKRFANRRYRRSLS